MSPQSFDFAARWRQVNEALMAGIEEWRLQHSKATLREIETAVDERLAGPRARMLHDVVLASRAANVSQANTQDRPVCPHCGTAVEPRGPRERQVMTYQGKILRLRCCYAVCPACQIGLFPPR